MRTLTLTAAAVAASAFLAFSAQAATLTMSTDKSTYNVSETITLTITGTSGGATATNVIGYINYANALTSVTSQSQTQYESFGGFIMWTVGADQVDNPIVGTASAFDQIGGLSPVPVSNDPLTAVITLSADALGVAGFSWLTTSTEALDYFGLTNSPGTTVTIVPEPTTAALLGMGLLGLAVAGRRR